MKRILSLALALLMCVGLIVPAAAASTEAQSAANSLNQLGLFNGVGTNADGSPNYDLDRAPTRAEAVTLLVRLLGKEADAKVGQWSNGFTDVPDWAKPYVGYAYQNGLTTGNSASSFGSGDTVSATQYLTFVLRALGYTSGTDFAWDKAFEKTDELGLTKGEYDANTAFLRGDAVLVSYRALDMKIKDGEQTLLAVIEENLKNAPPLPKTPAETVAGAIQLLKAAESVSYKMTMDLSLTASVAGQNMSESMSFIQSTDFFANPEKFKSIISGSSNGQPYASSELYLIPSGNAYTLYLKDEGEWYSEPVSKAEAAELSMASTLTMYLEGISGFALVGEKTLAGQKVTQYSGVLTNAKLTESIDMTSASEMLMAMAEGTNVSAAEIYAAMGDTPAMMYVNEAGYLVRFELDMREGMNRACQKILTALGGDGLGISISVPAALMAMEYSNYNSVPDFGAPAMN